MSLKSILEEINKAQKIISEDLSSCPLETLNGKRGKQRQAKEQLKILKRDYLKELRNTALFILVNGSDKELFCKTASESIPCFVENPKTFYIDLAKRIPRELYQNKTAVSNLFDILGRHLEDKMNELDIFEYNQLLFKSEYHMAIKDVNDFVRLIQRAVNEQIGTEIVGIQALYSVLDETIKNQHVGAITPILLPISDQNLIYSLLADIPMIGSKVCLINAGKSSKNLQSVKGSFNIKDVNAETVKEALSSIKNLIKKWKNN